MGEGLLVEGSAGEGCKKGDVGLCYAEKKYIFRRDCCCHIQSFCAWTHSSTLPPLRDLLMHLTQHSLRSFFFGLYQQNGVNPLYKGIRGLRGCL